jgi:glycosyltransferase involved in cell wall biosynthesis
MRIAQKQKIPLVASFHTKYHEDFKEAFKLDMVARRLISRMVAFFNAADSVWTVNERTACTLRDYGFRKSIEIVPNGTDFVPPDDLQRVRQELDQKFNFVSSDPVFLYAGQHAWKKNLRMLITALSHLKMSGCRFKMLFAGTGHAEKQIKDLVNHMNLSEQVVFRGLITDRDFLKSLFARADLFLFPSLYDTSGMVIQEAAAVTCPSVVIRNSNASEGITDNENGFISENNPEGFAEKIRQIVSNPQNMRLVGQKAQKTLYKTWDDVVKEVITRYFKIIESYRMKKP